MREIRLEEESSSLKKKLKEEIDKTEVTEDVNVTLIIKNGKSVKDLTFIDEYNKDGAQRRVTFIICYEFTLNENQAEGWLNFASKSFDKIQRQALNTAALTQRNIKKLIACFKVNGITNKTLKVLESIKNLTNPEPERLEIVFQIYEKLTCKSNSQIGWRDVYGEFLEKYEQWKLNDKLQRLLVKDSIAEQCYPNWINIVFSVKVTHENDVTNLRYFFPLYDFLTSISMGTLLKIYSDNKNIDGDEDEGDERRVMQFLSWIICDGTTIKAKYIRLNDKKIWQPAVDSSDMLPIICFREEDSPEQSSVTDSLIKAYFKDVENWEIDNKYKGFSETDKIAIQKKLCDTVIKNADIAGTKNGLQQKFLEYVKDIQNKFTFLVYLFLVRNLLSNDNILIYDGKDVKLNEILLKNTWENAKSYSEGLLQLIENAQKHSKGEKAFFGMRIYKANPNNTMSELLKESNTRTVLWNKYRRKSIIGGNIFNEKVWNTDEFLYSDFIEFYVLDNALDSGAAPAGIIDSIVKKGKVRLGVVDSIEKLFELNESDYVVIDADGNDSENKKLSFYIEHYGLRWMKRHVDSLNGIVEVFSPCGERENVKKQFFSSYKNAECKESDVKNLYFTEYSILVPLNYKKRQTEPKKTKNKLSGNPFKNISLKDKNFYDYVSVSVEEVKESSASKIEDVKETYEYLEKLFAQAAKDLNAAGDCNLLNYEGLLYIDAAKLSSRRNIEVFSKALFKAIFKRDKSKSLYIAVYFGGSKEKAKEFSRIFAVFYNKQDNSKYMDNVQIAVCSDGKDGDHKEVNFVLAGKKLENAYNTANNFVYYDAEASLEFLPLLKFFKTNGDKNSEFGEDKALRLFPFDLFLSDGAIGTHISPNETQKSNKTSWFLKQMLKRLNTNLDSEKYGCRVPDICARVGSKIYVDSFYEAELLFHNAGTVKRFAYLIASDIISSGKIKEGGFTFIVGYENYSAILIQEVERLLTEFYGSENKAFWLVDVRSDEMQNGNRLSKISFDNLSQDERNKIASSKIPVNCVTVLPINAAMSTVYKLHESFTRGIMALLPKENFQKKEKDLINFALNYCLVAVGNIFTGKADVGEKQFAEHYVKNINGEFCRYDSGWGVISLQPKKADPESPNTEVRFLLPVDSTWRGSANILHDGHSEFKPLVQVDNTSTLLDTYFQTELPEHVIEYYIGK